MINVQYTSMKIVHNIKLQPNVGGGVDSFVDIDMIVPTSGE